MLEQAIVPNWLSGSSVLDLLDVLIVAALLYGALAWLRRTRGGLLGLGLGLLGALYAGAGLLGLELTTRVFQAMGAAVLVVLVVVFQDELRQTFEEIAQRLLGRDVGPRMRVDARELLVSAAFRFARDKTGALIVLVGSQLIDRHCRGGVSLDGTLSEELLESVFDPHSSGHDGAVIVEGQRVRRFGVHLPLARSAASAGTRHSAALGLAERSDALAIVVSEERGAVSVARAGQLFAVKTPEELAHVIDHFLRERRPSARRRGKRLPLIGPDAGAKLGSLGAAAALWLWFVPGGEVVEAEFTLPVHVDDLPAGVEVGELSPALIEARLAGRRRDFALASEPRLAVSARGVEDAGRTRDDEVRLEARVNHAESLALVSLSAQRVALRLRRPE